MKQWQLLAVPLVVVMMLVPVTVAERTEVRTYEASAFLFSISGFDDFIGVTSDGTIDIGGVNFATQSTDASVRISIVDSVKSVIDPANAQRIPAIACQDIDGDSICDVEQEFCGNTVVQFGSDPLGFQGGLDLVVFVYLTEINTAVGNIDFCPTGPPQRAFQGTITATFS